MMNKIQCALEEWQSGKLVELEFSAVLYEEKYNQILREIHGLADRTAKSLYVNHVLLRMAHAALWVILHTLTTLTNCLCSDNVGSIIEVQPTTSLTLDDEDAAAADEEVFSDDEHILQMIRSMSESTDNADMAATY